MLNQIKSLKDYDIKVYIKESAKIGLLSFVLCFFMSVIIAIIINFTALSILQSVTIGAMGDDGGTIFGRIIRMTLIIMNFSVFNSIGELRIGIIIFAILPCIAFFVAKNKNHTKDGLNLYNIVIYILGSVIFSTLLLCLSFITQGTFMGIYIRFASLRNLLLTIVVTFLIQLMIGMNYNRNARSSVKATRVMIWMLMGVGAVLALIDLIKLIGQTSISIFEKIFGILILLPNFTIYKSLVLMGNDLQTSETLTTIISDMTTLQLSFSTLPIVFKIIAVILLMLMVVISILFIKKESYFADLAIFSLAISLIMTFLAYLASTDLGEIILVGKIFIGTRLVIAFLVPFIFSLVLGLMVFLVRKMIEIILEV